MTNSNMIRREVTFLPEAFDILKETQRRLMDIHHRSFTNSEVIARILSASTPEEIAKTSEQPTQNV